MSQSSPARWLAALPAAMALAAAAQNPPPAPADPLPYRSAFEGYQRFEDAPPASSWKLANDTVRQRGGWRAYAADAAAAPADAARPPPPDPHAGHGSHATPPAAPPTAKERP